MQRVCSVCAGSLYLAPWLGVQSDPTAGDLRGLGVLGGARPVATLSPKAEASRLAPPPLHIRYARPEAMQLEMRTARPPLADALVVLG